MSQNGEYSEGMRRARKAALLDVPMDDRPPRIEILRKGLDWLLATEQPADALISHHGLTIHGPGNRHYSFIPSGANHAPVVVCDVTKVKRDVDSGVCVNPLRKGEMDEVEADIRSLGITVTGRWNGKYETGSLQLGYSAHDSLLRAVGRYRSGCSEHPSRSVFCDCGWYGRGLDRIVYPDWDTVGAV